MFYHRLYTAYGYEAHKCHWLYVGLGGIAILVLDILYEKTRYYYLIIYRGSYKDLCVDCSFRVFRSFSFIWFCKYQAFVCSITTITNLLPSKQYLGTVKPQ